MGVTLYMNNKDEIILSFLLSVTWMGCGGVNQNRDLWRRVWCVVS